MPSELDSSSGEPGRALPIRPWWIAAALAALAIAWWVFRPERANPLPRDEAHGAVQAAPPASASFEFYTGEVEGGAADPALAPNSPAATKVPVVPPARGPVPPAKVKSSGNTGPDSNVPRDVAVLPPHGREQHGERPFACSAATHRPPCAPFGARPRPAECATPPSPLAP